MCCTCPAQDDARLRLSSDLERYRRAGDTIEELSSVEFLSKQSWPEPLPVQGARALPVAPSTTTTSSSGAVRSSGDSIHVSFCCLLTARRALVEYTIGSNGRSPLLFGSAHSRRLIRRCNTSAVMATTDKQRIMVDDCIIIGRLTPRRGCTTLHKSAANYVARSAG
jgi:hypothetical protein